jgi:hypothetical protein
MHVIPELAEPRETQGIVGDKTRSIIDHKDETAGQQQEPYKAEKTADHVSPNRLSRPFGPCQPLTAQHRKFNLVSTLSALLAAVRRAPARLEAVDASWRDLYKSANGGGRNPAAAVL